MSSDATEALAPQAFDLVRSRFQSMLQGLHSTTLSNGARLHVLPTGNHGIVAFEVWASVGSGDEPPAAAGISHLLEHLMFRGTEDVPDGEFDAVIEAYGVKANAWTWYDTTAYTAIAPVEALDKIMHLEADRFQNLRITPEVFETEQQVVLNERSLTADSDPAVLAQEHLDRLLFDTGPYAHAVIGDKETIASFTREQVTDWYRQHYAPSELDIFVVGDVQVADVEALTRKTFGQLPTATTKRPERPQSQSYRKGIVDEIQLPVAEPLVMIAWGRELRSDLKAAATWKMMSEWLTFSRGGELRNALEYNQRYALEQQFYVNDHRLGHSGLWEATPREGFDPKDLAKAFYQTMAELAEKGPSDEALDAARVRILAYYAACSTPWLMVRQLGSALHDTGSIDNLVHELDALRAVTAEDIRALAARLANPDESVLLYVMPE